MFNVEKIRNQISLRALAEEAGAEFNNNHYLSSHCPLPRHVGDRSSLAFTIYDHGQSWKCHSSCPSDANGGDVISFYMAWKNVDFITACNELTERAVNPRAFLPRQESITDISADFPSELPIRICCVLPPAQWMAQYSAELRLGSRCLPVLCRRSV